MWAARNIQRQCIKTISVLQLRNAILGHVSSRPSENYGGKLEAQSNAFGSFDGSRLMSTSKGRSMRSKVERRMRKETGTTLREIRRAKKLRKKLMTDEERLLYNLRRAKKKVALLLQKLKKYELPELPSPRHDPELLTPEQLQAYKKIGFRNRNYVPVGVRGVFGGVVQNMHLHWKFHETVQVCCDNFPKEKIKEMATMLARLSGGIVVNIHDVKTIIMFRGRNYRQPKNLIPINTLTKRKALFKARFEQALESQKLNIKKTEQQLRRMGVNPEDPVAMASIQRVASTFFRAIDEKQGTPYVFPGDKQSVPNLGSAEDSGSLKEEEHLSEDSDQEELDRFIAEIEDAADREYEEEEAKEKEEMSKIRYWNKEDLGGRGRRDFGSGDSDGEVRERIGTRHGRKDFDSRPLKDAIRHGGRGEYPRRDFDSGDSEDETRHRGKNQLHSRRRTAEVHRWDSEDSIAGPSVNDELDSDVATDLPNFESDEDNLSGGEDDWQALGNLSEGNTRRVQARKGGAIMKQTEEPETDDELEDFEGGSWRSDGEERHRVKGSKENDFDYFSSSGDER